MGAESRNSRLKDHAFLFSISFLSLFLELLLIRWIGTEIRIFSYFRNLVLISCFLGLGIGFSLKKARVSLLTSVLLTLVLVASAHPRAMISGFSLRDISQYLVFDNFHMWFTPGRPSLAKFIVGFVMIAGVMIVLAGIFVPFGQILGDIFDSSRNRIRDYSINLAGALLGTWAFALLSYLGTPPWIWFLAAAGCAVGMIKPRSRKTILGLILLMPILVLTVYGNEPGKDETYWSPYQKISITKAFDANHPGPAIPFLGIEVNSTLYMCIYNLAYDMGDRFPMVFNRADAPYYPYDLPYRFQPKPARVLIVGAGAGNDAAAALRNGAGHVDAVEIDPVIAKLGRLYHPEHPYQDPRVSLVIDDARSFFKKTKEHYDLILFGLLDSHTLTSNFTNINLDSYVYTMESIAEARGRLAPGGVIVITFLTERKWLGYKLYDIIKQVFRRPPLILSDYSAYMVQGTRATMFVAGDLATLLERIESDPRLLAKMTKQGIPNQGYEQWISNIKISVPEDDWPYLYLQKREIPTLHLIMTVIILAMMFLAVRLLMPGGKVGPSHFLFLGAGFMLVEVHSISKVALLFGSTWIVNVVIISAILVMILLANLLVLKFRIERVTWWYAGLFASLMLAYFIPVHSLILGSYLVRGILAGTFYSLPMFFAGVVFATSIKKVAGVEAAFAANMLGSAIGGMLESASFVTGIRAVVLIAIFLYLCSALTLKKMPTLKSE
jgi:SAM-dependent methyltransferase